MGQASSRLRISILLPDLRGGGAERVSLDLAREFVQAGHDVEIVLMTATGEFIEEASASLKIVDLMAARMRQVPRLLARYLRGARPDVLLAAMWPLTSAAVMARLLSRHRFRLIIAEHGMTSIQYRQKAWHFRLAQRLSMALAYRVADAGVGVSRGVADDIARLAWLPPEHVHVINNSVEQRSSPDAATLQRVDRLWGVPHGGRAMSVGRFKAVKNYPLLLDAFALVVEHVDAKLMLVGAGEDEAALRSRAERLGIASRVIFPGFQPDPTPFYLTADLFVLSSDSEGLPTVLIEALAHGLPVVSTDCPSGPAEILEKGIYGTLVPMGDKAALADAIRHALSHGHDKDMLRSRANDFSPQRASERYLALFTGISA